MARGKKRSWNGSASRARRPGAEVMEILDRHKDGGGLALQRDRSMTGFVVKRSLLTLPRRDVLRSNLVAATAELSARLFKNPALHLAGLEDVGPIIKASEITAEELEERLAGHVDEMPETLIAEVSGVTTDDGERRGQPVSTVSLALKPDTSGGPEEQSLSIYGAIPYEGAEIPGGFELGLGYSARGEAAERAKAIVAAHVQPGTLLSFGECALSFAY